MSDHGDSRRPAPGADTSRAGSAPPGPHAAARQQRVAPTGLAGRIVDAAAPELQARARGSRRRTAAVLALLLGVPAAVLAVRLATAPGEAPPAERLDARWLAQRVAADGTLADEAVAPGAQVGLQALALVALARGVEQPDAEVREAIARAGRWLVERRAADGALAGPDEDQALGTVALIEAWRVTGDNELRRGAEAALGELLQREAWGGERGERGVAAAAWGLEALGAAREAGLSGAGRAEERARERLVAVLGGDGAGDARRRGLVGERVAPRQAGLGDVYVAAVGILAGATAGR